MRYIVDPETGCHLWTGTKSDKGYAIINILGKRLRVTRLLWTILRGRIPPGRLMCHHCDNPGCINLEHVYCGTHFSNVKDAVRRSRYHSPKGEANAEAKLTADQVREIRKSKVKGITLAEIYRVSPATISKIRTGKLWSHLK